MKILEAQSATLTNYEVYTHLTEQRARYEAGPKKRRGPGNLETIVREMLDYLRTAPSPLGNVPLPYHSRTIKTLLERLRRYDLTKAEFLMIMNLRPTTSAALAAIVEEFELRFPDSNTQDEMLQVITEVLGSTDGAAERQAMEDNAKNARDREMDEDSREAVSVEMDVER